MQGREYIINKQLETKMNFEYIEYLNKAEI